MIAVAVTRTGIPVRLWYWPGNTNDQELTRQTKDYLRAWKLSAWCGSSSAAFNRPTTAATCSGPADTIFGEKLRGNDQEAQAALARHGRYHTVAQNLRVKEAIIDDDARPFVICHNREDGKRDKQIREHCSPTTRSGSPNTDAPPASERHTLYGKLSAKRGYERFLRQTKNGKLRIDRAAVKAEASRRQVPAAHLRPRPSPPRALPWATAALGDRARVARHEDHAGPTRRTHARCMQVGVTAVGVEQ